MSDFISWVKLMSCINRESFEFLSYRQATDMRFYYVTDEKGCFMQKNFFYSQGKRDVIFAALFN